MSQRLNKNTATRINFDIHNVLTINIKYMNKTNVHLFVCMACLSCHSDNSLCKLSVYSKFNYSRQRRKLLLQVQTDLHFQTKQFIDGLELRSN